MSKTKKHRPDSNKEPSNGQKNIFANFKWSYVINFIITLTGVFCGVTLSNWVAQSSKNESTNNNFNQLYTECYHNLGSCKQIYYQLNDTSFTDFIFPLIYVDVSNKLILDDNFYNVGNIELYDLLLTYNNLAENLNMQLDSYIESYINDNSLMTNEILLMQTSMFIAINYRIRKRLRELNLVTHIITDINKKNLKELKKVAQAVLEGNFIMVRGDSSKNLPKSWKKLSIEDLYP